MPDFNIRSVDDLIAHYEKREAQARAHAKEAFSITQAQLVNEALLWKQATAIARNLKEHQDGSTAFA